MYLSLTLQIRQEVQRHQHGQGHQHGPQLGLEGQRALSILDWNRSDRTLGLFPLG
jgi:hypothetical protein